MKKQTIFLLSSIFFALDLVVKQVIRLFLTHSLPLIPHFLSLTYTENRGAAWGIFDQYPILLIGIAIFFLWFLLHNIKQEAKIKKITGLAYALILGGLLGNLFDRLFFGYVIDYIQVFLGNYAFPIFNLADTFLVVGIILWIIKIIRGEKHEL